MADVARIEGRGDRTRRRVLEAALEVVRDRPLAEVQLQQIAARAGISPGHVLYHFGSKDRILVETLRWSEDALAQRRANELGALHDPIARLERWTELFLPHESNDPTWKLWLELWLRSATYDDLHEVIKRVADRWIDDLDAIVEAGVRAGAFDRPDEDFTRRFHSFLIGLSIGVLAGHESLADARGLALRSVGRELGYEFPPDPRT